MPDIPVITFLNFFIYLSIPFLFGYVAKLLKAPPVIGYMIGGVVLGNVFSDLISRDIINQFAYFGILLLLFTVGLEVNFSRMLALKKFILIGGVAQIFLSIIFVFLISLFFDFSILQSLLIGIALSSSSTSLVAKLIQDRGEEGSFLGELALGILMLQDLALIPFLIIFTSITSNIVSPLAITQQIFIDLIIAATILAAMYYLGQKIIPIIFDRVAAVSREILNFFIIIFIFLVALLSSIFHLPILIGMFVAGVLVSQTTQHYHIFSRVRPLRDILATIFFIYIGTNVNMTGVAPQLLNVAVFVTLVFLAKGLILFFVFLFLKFSTRLSFYTSLSLFQISENAFILMSIAAINNIVSQDQYLFIVATILIGLLFTPIFIINREKMYLRIRKFIAQNLPVIEQLIKRKIDFSISAIDAMKIRNHVIICGYGRVGSTVGKALQLANIAFVAIDYNFHTVQRAKGEGINIIYGDPTDIDVLDFVECEHALMLISAVSARFDQEAIILNAKKLNPKLYIIGRVHEGRDHQRLRDLGAKIIVQPELEASISIIKRILIVKKVPKEEIVKALRHLKLIHGSI